MQVGIIIGPHHVASRRIICDCCVAVPPPLGRHHHCVVNRHPHPHRDPSVVLDLDSRRLDLLPNHLHGHFPHSFFRFLDSP